MENKNTTKEEKEIEDNVKKLAEIMKKGATTEIARSFSYKLNVGNFESRDFFCSQKEECLVSESEETSRRLFDFCKKEVLRDVATYLKEQDDLKNAKSIKAEKKENALDFGEDES